MIVVVNVAFKDPDKVADAVHDVMNFHCSESATSRMWDFSHET